MAIRVDHLTKVFEVDGLSFEVEPGERLAHIGPNGAGKSTSTKILTGCLPRSTGSTASASNVAWASWPICSKPAIASTFQCAACPSLNTRMIADIGIHITSGAIAVELLRPASVLAQRVVSELDRVLPRVVVCALAGVLLAWITAGHPPSGIALAVAAPSLVLAVMCNIVAQHAFAALSFWLGHSGGAWFLYQKLIFMVGGMLIPLEVLPGWLRAT